MHYGGTVSSTSVPKLPENQLPTSPEAEPYSNTSEMNSKKSYTRNDSTCQLLPAPPREFVSIGYNKYSIPSEQSPRSCSRVIHLPFPPLSEEDNKHPTTLCLNLTKHVPHHYQQISTSSSSCATESDKAALPTNQYQFTHPNHHHQYKVFYDMSSCHNLVRHAPYRRTTPSSLEHYNNANNKYYIQTRPSSLSFYYNQLSDDQTLTYHHQQHHNEPILTSGSYYKSRNPYYNYEELRRCENGFENNSPQPQLQLDKSFTDLQYNPHNHQHYHHHHRRYSIMNGTIV
jgi:hypothetical protein